MRIFGITLDNQDLLKDVIIPKGKIKGEYGLFTNEGTVILEDAIIDSSSEENMAFMNPSNRNSSGVFELNGGIVYGGLNSSSPYMINKVVLNKGVFEGSIWSQSENGEPVNTVEINNDVVV